MHVTWGRRMLVWRPQYVSAVVVACVALSGTQSRCPTTSIVANFELCSFASQRLSPRTVTMIGQNAVCPLDLERVPFLLSLCMQWSRPHQLGSPGLWVTTNRPLSLLKNPPLTSTMSPVLISVPFLSSIAMSLRSCVCRFPLAESIIPCPASVLGRH